MSRRVWCNVESISIAFNGLCVTQDPIYRDWLLEEAARKSGFVISPIGDKCTRLHVEINYSSEKSPKNFRGIPRENRVLFALEPRAVLPMQHRKRVRRRFGLVLVSSPNQVHSPTDVYFDFGFLFPKEQVASELPRKMGSVAMLNANKSSFVSGSQYNVRKSLIKKLAHTGFSVTIAGAGWERSFPAQILDSVRSLLFCISQGEWPDVTRFSIPIKLSLPNVEFSGVVADGDLFYRQHEFALIVENDPQYISEKLFHALESGCVPLYLGPKLQTIGVPESLIVDLSKESESSLSMLLRSDAPQKDLVRKAGKSYMTDPGVQEYWSHRSGVLRFFSSLREYLNK